MAEKDFEEQAQRLREMRDIYAEEESGVEEAREVIGIVPGAPGVRPPGGARPGEERAHRESLREVRRQLEGLTKEIGELKEVVSELRKQLGGVSDTFRGFQAKVDSAGTEVKETLEQAFEGVGEKTESFTSRVEKAQKDLGRGVKGLNVELKRITSGLKGELGNAFQVVQRGVDLFGRTLHVLLGEGGRYGEISRSSRASRVYGLSAVGGYGFVEVPWTARQVSREVVRLGLAHVFGPFGEYVEEIGGWLISVVKGRVRGKEETIGPVVRKKGVEALLVKDGEIIQERQAKIYADKLYIEAKTVEGLKGKAGLVGGILGGMGLFRLLRILSGVGLVVGAGLGFYTGFRKEGIGLGIARGLGALGGGLAGAKLGALIGSAVLPGIGAVIGTLLGGLAGILGGEKIGDAVYSGMKKLVKDRVWIEQLQKAFVTAIVTAITYLRDVVEVIGKGLKVVGGKVSEGVRKGGAVLKEIGEWIGEKLGFIARKVEAGTLDMIKASQVVSKVAGDIGGMSAGMYQFIKDVQLKFLREYGYEKEFEGVRFGTREWERRWKEVAQKYGEEFARAQHEFALREYFVPGARVARRFGIDVEKSRAIQEMVFARAVQHGVKGFERVLRNAFAGMTVEQIQALLPEQVVQMVYGHLIENVDQYWRRSSPKVREAVRRRLNEELRILLALIEQEKVYKKVTTEAKEVYEGLREQREIIERYSILGSLVRQERWQDLVAKETQGIYEGLREYRDILEGAIQDVFGAVKAQVSDLALESMQEEMMRRLVGVDVRRELEVLSGISDTLEKVLTPIMGEVGGRGKVILSGGEPLRNVPLFVDDLGIVMLQLGLV